ncbi:MAG: Macrolide export protein MacA, partial [Planctomycetota bacterium]
MATSASPTNRWLRRLALLGTLATGTLALGALGPKYLSNSPKTKHLTHVLTRGDLAVTVTENGAVESSNNKEIKCLVKGGSTVLWVIETGTMVKPGDELVKLDQSQIEDKILQQKIVYENAL